MLQGGDPCVALPNPHLLIFVDPEIGQQDAAEDDGSCQQEDLDAAPQAGAQADGRNHRGRGQREVRRRVDLGWSEVPWAFRIYRDPRQVGGRQYALAHFVGPPRALGQFQVVRDEHEAEQFRPLQLLEQIDDVGLGVFVEIAGRLVGKQQRRRIDERTGNGDAALLAAGHAAGIRIGAVPQPHTREQIVGARVGLSGIHGASEQRRNGDIVHRRQIREQARELEDEADAARTEGCQLRF